MKNEKEIVRRRQNIFQIKLTILTIIGMLVSGIVSGYYVYWFTSDKEPYLIVSPYRVITPNGTILIQIVNTKEIPATMIRLIYHIEGSIQKATAKPTYISYLS